MDVCLEVVGDGGSRRADDKQLPGNKQAHELETNSLQKQQPSSSPPAATRNDFGNGIGGLFICLNP
ncbi:uncharacterized protein EAE98_000877 [Botrytis deweyae]|uniref:Uncharacterized protein n=2 Tax=Botrytis TaxID=33196 RepID=A0A4Z1JMN1_9HELO|nr:uncharacterized protein EAE98_000877 [Botrytis deweyae]KAF7934411.1 hypothetical protein EAE99_002863 [Botrytis elliptica]KAF7938539.1 hypothetical protein EAE98_000877 [Botrytis deweyae]TGO72552.1 hypothetical protein BELL_0442g00090 [Botrytis elliptica]